MALNLVVADVRIGTPGREMISQAHQRFQNDVIELLFPDTEIKRLGHRHSFALSYDKVTSDSRCVASICRDAVSTPTIKKADILLLDLTSSFDIVREPVLYMLAEEIASLSAEEKLVSCVILLPFASLPGSQSTVENTSSDPAVAGSPMVQRLSEIRTDAINAEVILLANSGQCLRITDRVTTEDAYKEDYLSLLQELDKDPRDQLDQKKVRRIGRFRSDRYPAVTQLYSYIIDNCDDEFYRLLCDSWDSASLDCNAIVHDTGNIPSMTSAVRAFAAAKCLPSFSMHRLTARDLATLGNDPTCLLILDVVATGRTLSKHTDDLHKLGCTVNSTVLAAINKGGSRESTFGDYHVSSFLAVGSDPEWAIELQEDLSLPYTPYADDPLPGLRSFDMWYMAHESGWEQEPEVPDNIGYGYDIVPDFPKMMSEFGDWIAYKMEKQLRQSGYPDDLFIVHPDEPAANAVSDRLRSRLGSSTMVIRVPREVIKAAQGVGNDWDRTIAMITENGADPPEWLYSLESIQDACALITDIFNASGSTFRSLKSLLDSYGLRTLCYFPFIDRDGFRRKPQEYPTTCRCLYSWYGPRTLLHG